MNFGILRLYCGESGKKGFYNMQELGLAKSMSKLGVNVFIFLLDSKIKNSYVEKFNDRISFVFLPCKRMNNHGIFNCNFIKKFNINLLQIQSDNQLYAPKVIHFCKKNKIKFYNYIGTIESDSKNILKKVIMDLIVKINIHFYKKNINYCKTPYIQEILLEKGVDNVNVLPVGLDVENIKVKLSKKEIFNKYNLSKNKKYVIFVGRLEKYKNPMQLSILLQSIKEKYNLIIVGAGSLKEKLLNEFKRLGLTDRMQYIEKISNDEIHELYSISDYFVNFNETEIFGMSLLEAIFNGCTALAFPAPGPNFILEENIGFLCSDVKEMINIINGDVLIDKSSLKNYVMNKFNWDINAKEIKGAFYEN